MAFPLKNGDWALERGAFTFELAKDADTPAYAYVYEQPQTLVIDRTRRGFFAEASVGE